MNIAYVIDWRKPTSDHWHRKEIQTTSTLDPLSSAAETIAFRYSLSRAPIVRDGMVIRVRVWRYDGTDDLMALDPEQDAPDSVWTCDPTT